MRLRIFGPKTGLGNTMVLPKGKKKDTLLGFVIGITFCSKLKYQPKPGQEEKVTPEIAARRIAIQLENGQKVCLVYKFKSILLLK